MPSEKLARARAYQRQQTEKTDKTLLPAFHVTGGTGWINDPNGFSVYRGEYHLFFQYYPYDVTWGPMHWGHVKSRDFVRWEHLPAALAPDAPFDRDGCFSGSAIELDDGRQMLLYTGVRRFAPETGPEQGSGTAEELEDQCAAFGDGIDYEKFPGNPVISGDSLPEGFSKRDFRDPKIWREGDVYRAVAGNRAPDGNGQILLFESPDALHWTYLGILARSGGEYGRMWECPDFFFLDGEYVLLTSPQEMCGEGLEFHPGYGTLCLLGSYDGESHRLTSHAHQSIDYGLDFYAPQTLEAPDGRRVMVAWMQNWNTTGCKKEGLPFFGQMTFPRELHVSGGRLVQLPVREIEAYRTKPVIYRDFPLSEETALPGVEGRVLDMTVRVRPDPGGRTYGRFVLRLARGGGCFTEISYIPAEGVMVFDRSRSGLREDIVNRRVFPVPYREEGLTLRVLLDRWSCEVFAAGGAAACSAVLYTPQDAGGISFRALGGRALLDVEKYELEL